MVHKRSKSAQIKKKRTNKKQLYQEPRPQCSTVAWKLRKFPNQVQLQRLVCVSITACALQPEQCILISQESVECACVHVHVTLLIFELESPGGGRHAEAGHVVLSNVNKHMSKSNTNTMAKSRCCNYSFHQAAANYLYHCWVGAKRSPCLFGA